MNARKNQNGTAPAIDPDAANNALAWLRTRVAELRSWSWRRSPPMPRRPRLRVRPASSWSSFWSARAAVRARVPVEAFLQHRLSHSVGRLPVSPDRLPEEFSVLGSTIVRTPRPGPLPNAPWLDSVLRAYGPPAVNPEILLGQADAARLAARIDAQRARVDELTHDVEAATRGVAIADPGDEVQANQMGRPVVPQPFGLALQIFAVVLLLAESWPLVTPCMEVAGIQSGHLVTEVQRNPIGVLLGSLFALGAAATLFLFAYLSVRRAVRVVETNPGAYGAWTALGALIAVLLTLAMAWSTAGVRPGPNLPIEGGYARATVFLALLAIPFTSAWLFTAGRRLDQVRSKASALARAWDQEHYRSLADINRRATALAEEERRLSTLEAERATVVERLRTLQERVGTAERLAADAAAEEAQDLRAIAQALSATLELDRYEYIRQAGRRGIPVAQPEPAETPPPVAAPVRGSREQRNLELAG